MATDREIALEQALVAAYSAAASLGIDHDTLYSKARQLIDDHSEFAKLQYPLVTFAHRELFGAWEQFKMLEG